jgi:triosephosphate isomerase
MKKIVIGNLKMNLLSPAERDLYLKGMDRVTAGKKFAETEIVLCPPFVHLEGFKKWKNRKVARGAQNMFIESKGSYTGEISPLMLKNFGCDYVIVGHSERRKYFGESKSFINHKIISALSHGLKPILCVGETKTEKDNDLTLEVITQQVKEALVNVSRAKAKQIIIAYEPVWSVGSDVVPSSNEIMGAKLLVRKILHELFGKKYALEVAILYGGNINAKTVKQVCIDSEVDGALIGRDSLRPSEFMKIVKIINENS